MRNSIPALIALAVIALYGALGWQHLVAGDGFVLPRAAAPAETRRPPAEYRFTFERGGRNCALPSWRV